MGQGGATFTHKLSKQLVCPDTLKDDNNVDAPVINKLLKFVLLNKVVDVACGTARYYPEISKIGEVRYIGIDSSPLHISRNKQSFPDAEFVNSNCLENGVVPECDVIIASHFIEHLENPLDFLLQIKGRCNKLIIEVPDFYSDPINLVSFNLGTPWWTDRDHFREYSEDTLRALLTEAEYKTLDQKISGGTIAVVVEPKIRN